MSHCYHSVCMSVCVCVCVGVGASTYEHADTHTHTHTHTLSLSYALWPPLLPLTCNVATSGIYVNHFLCPTCSSSNLWHGWFLALRPQLRCHLLGEALPDSLWKTPFSPTASHFYLGSSPSQHLKSSKEHGWAERLSY